MFVLDWILSPLYMLSSIILSEESYLAVPLCVSGVVEGLLLKRQTQAVLLNNTMLFRAEILWLLLNSENLG